VSPLKAIYSSRSSPVREMSTDDVGRRLASLLAESNPMQRPMKRQTERQKAVTSSDIALLQLLESHTRRCQHPEAYNQAQNSVRLTGQRPCLTTCIGIKMVATPTSNSSRPHTKCRSHLALRTSLDAVTESRKGQPLKIEDHVPDIMLDISSAERA